MRRFAAEETLIPHEVVSATVDGASPMKAWREHLGLTQAAVAARLGVSQAAYAQSEAAARRPLARWHWRWGLLWSSWIFECGDGR